MDEQPLQQKEAELKTKESNLEVKEAELKTKESNLEAKEAYLNLQETRAQFGIELSINKQEFLRRAIEVGAQALNKLDDMHATLEHDKLKIHLEELVNTAVVKLTQEIIKLN